MHNLTEKKNMIDQEQTIEEALNENDSNEKHLMKFNQTYKPFFFPWAVELTRTHENVHWVEDEADLSDDVADWKSSSRLTTQERDFITNILRLFTQSDVAVGQNYFDQFIPRFKNNEVRNMLGSFAAREGIHQRAYALLNDTLGLPESEYHAFLEYSEMADKIDFMMDSDPDTTEGMALALAKAVFNEGLSLFASFVMLLNFQRFGKMRGMCKITEWSLRDEAVTLDTSLVTPEGLKQARDIQVGDTVLCYDTETRKESFQEVQKRVEVEREYGLRFEGKDFIQEVSPGHRMIVEKDGQIIDIPAEEIDLSEDAYFIISGETSTKFDDGTEKLNLIERKAKGERKIHFTEVNKTEIDNNDFVCFSVPGGAFVIDVEGSKSVTGNTIHVEGEAMLFKAYVAENPEIVTDFFKKRIYDMARKVVELEDRFVDLVFSMGDPEGLTKEEVKLYIRYVADRRLIQLGLKGNYGIKENPLPWLGWVTGDRHASFFETRVADYDVAGLKGEWRY